MKAPLCAETWRATDVEDPDTPGLFTKHAKNVCGPWSKLPEKKTWDLESKVVSLSTFPEKRPFFRNRSQYVNVTVLESTHILY